MEKKGTRGKICLIERDDCTRVEAGLKSGNSKPVLGLIISSEKMLTLGDPKRGDKNQGPPTGFRIGVEREAERTRLRERKKGKRGW